MQDRRNTRLQLKQIRLLRLLLLSKIRLLIKRLLMTNNSNRVDVCLLMSALYLCFSIAGGGYCHCPL